MANPVFITDFGSFLPNAPVANDRIEDVLGMVGGRKSRARAIVLRNNGIRTRHYAVDPASGAFTHTNARMTAEAVRALVARSGIGLDDIDCLCCGTSSPDQIQPSHGCMVQGELALPPREVVTTSGVCLCGLAAMKYAWMTVAAGLVGRAVSTGSEFASSVMKASTFWCDEGAGVDELEKRPSLAFEKDFLRWMLSDGAGAALLTNRRAPDRLALAVDWIETRSYAGRLPVCMYAGAVKREDGSLEGMRSVDQPARIVKEHFLALKQDARLLDEHMVAVATEVLLEVAGKRGLAAGDVTWFLPHYSSEYFRPRLHAAFAAAGFPIDFARWFSNLPAKGNVGSAAIYLILEELFYSGRLKRGDRLLCLVPESARFSVGYMLLTVV
ncbi:MAG TPA: beta-ketoacyl-ACP synthase III [bacterium]